MVELYCLKIGPHILCNVFQLVVMSSPITTAGSSLGLNLNLKINPKSGATESPPLLAHIRVRVLLPWPTNLQPMFNLIQPHRRKVIHHSNALAIRMHIMKHLYTYTYTYLVKPPCESQQSFNRKGNYGTYAG